MARELYNWDQNKGYSIIALCNVLKNSGLDDEIKKIIIAFIKLSISKSLGTHFISNTSSSLEGL